MERKKKPKKAEIHPQQEEQIIASEEIISGPQPSSENNDLEGKQEVVFPDQDETTSVENNKLPAHQSEAPDDVHELIAPENNGIKKKQDEVTIESQEIISEERNDSLEEISTALSNSLETGLVDSNELKSEKNSKPAKPEISSF